MSQIQKTFTASMLGIPAGANTEVQFNDAGTLGADAGLTYNKTTNILNVDNIQFDITPTSNTASNGLLYWDTANETLSFDVTSGSIQIGQESFDYYTNLQGAPIVNGDIVSIVGASGNRTAVALTDATNHAKSMACLGMVTVPSIANTAVGRITKSGKVRGLNTIAYVEGTELFVDPANPGKWTSTPPSAPNHYIKIGIVEVAHAVVGVIELNIHVNPNFTDLSDVNGTPLTVTGQIPVWNNTAGYFDFTSNITNYPTGSSTSGYITFWNGTSTITGDSSFLWDNTNKVITFGGWKPTSDSATALRLFKANGTTSVFTLDTTNSRLGLGVTPASKLHLDGGTGTATYLQFTNGTTTGQGSTDGTRVGLDASGNFSINQRENLNIDFYQNNNLVFSTLSTLISFGDLGGTSTGTRFDIYPVAGQIQASNVADGVMMLIKPGDFSFNNLASGKIKFNVGDPAIGEAGLLINCDYANTTVAEIKLELPSGKIRLGDTNAFSNNTIFDIDILNDRFSFQNTGNETMSLSLYNFDVFNNGNIAGGYTVTLGNAASSREFLQIYSDPDPYSSYYYLNSSYSPILIGDVVGNNSGYYFSINADSGYYTFTGLFVQFLTSGLIFGNVLPIYDFTYESGHGFSLGSSRGAGVGGNLVFRAGDSVSGGLNTSGGSIIFYDGIRTGNSLGTSFQWYTSDVGVSGTADQAQTVKMSMSTKGDLETVRGKYHYHSQTIGQDTAGDWRTYSDANGFYTDYCTVGNVTKGSGTWVNKQTIYV